MYPHLMIPFALLPGESWKMLPWHFLSGLDCSWNPQPSDQVLSDLTTQAIPVLMLHVSMQQLKLKLLCLIFPLLSTFLCYNSINSHLESKQWRLFHWEKQIIRWTLLNAVQASNKVCCWQICKYKYKTCNPLNILHAMLRLIALPWICEVNVWISWHF